MNLEDIEIAWEYGTKPPEEAEEIIRNIHAILTTPIGTCPLYRDFGIDTSFLDKPLILARSLAAVEIVTKVERWEPRVRVTSTSVDPGADGQLRAKVVIVRE